MTATVHTLFGTLTRGLTRIIANRSRTVLVLGIFAAADAAHADTLRLSFSGTTQISSASGDSVASLPIYSVGSTFSGYIDFDNAIADTYAGGVFGTYNGAILSYHLTIDGTEYVLDPSAGENVISTANDYGWAGTQDILQPFLNSTVLLSPSVDSTLLWQSQLNLWSTNTGVFSTDALPTSLPAVALFDQLSEVHMYAFDSNFLDNWYWQGQITDASIAPSSVPLPAGIWLLLSGLGSAGALARARRRIPLAYTASVG